MNPSTNKPRNLGRKVAAGVVGLAALGASTLVAPSFASAQEATPAPEVTTPDTDRPDRSDREARRADQAERKAAFAELLGATTEELREAKQNGQSLADVAAANGVDIATVTDAMEAAINERIDEAVAEGHLTAEEADERRAMIAEKVEDKVNGVRGDGEGRRGHRGHRHGPRSAADADATTGAVFSSARFGGGLSA